MTFSPAKSELLHFSRKKAAPTETVVLDEATTLQPRPHARFLGIWLDRKLLFGEHTKAVLAKLKKQSYALTRLTAKTWGYTLSWARTIFDTVIRNTIAYGEAIYHRPTPKGATYARGPALRLEQAQLLI